MALRLRLSTDLPLSRYCIGIPLGAPERLGGEGALLTIKRLYRDRTIIGRSAQKFSSQRIRCVISYRMAPLVV